MSALNLKIKQLQEINVFPSITDLTHFHYMLLQVKAIYIYVMIKLFSSKKKTKKEPLASCIAYIEIFKIICTCSLLSQSYDLMVPDYVFTQTRWVNTACYHDCWIC